MFLFDFLQEKWRKKLKNEASGRISPEFLKILPESRTCFQILGGVRHPQPLLDR
jgi:hypothetical protein